MTQPRRMLVLRAIVEDYIRSQEPIGSSALTKTHDLGVSSATIRNDMAALEDEGYLIQPHTSAGRIPTEKGYRYFVDRLSTVMPLSRAQRNGIATFLSGSVSLQDTLQRAARLLSQITGQIAVVASPSLAKATMKHVEIVPVGVEVLLAVVITDTGRVVQHTLMTPMPPHSQELAEFCAAVNSQCSGLSFSQASEQVRRIGDMASVSRISTVARSLSAAFETMADDERADELYMAGVSNLAHQSTSAELAPLFDALEEQVVLMRLMSELSEDTDHSGVGVAIGSETHTPGLMHVSVVTSGYGGAVTDLSDDSGVEGMDDGSSSQPGRSRPQKQNLSHDEQSAPCDGPTDADGFSPSARTDPVAFIGSIGPTHMDYATTIAAVRTVARYLTLSIDSGGVERD